MALGIGVAAGVLTSFVAPRGPTTAANALFVMTVGLFLGTTGGALVRSRWSLVVLFVVYFLGIEAGRLYVVGPSLDLRLDNPYGAIAFVLTRGIHSILVLPPLAFGVLIGLAVARRLRWSPNATRRRLPIGSALVGIIATGLAILVAWPASTPPVMGRDGLPATGGIAEMVTVHLGGTDQTVMIRAADPDRPRLLAQSCRAPACRPRGG